jgi:hypothetical protein
MKDITFAPAYVAMYPILAQVAREHGYSLCVHGSVGRTNASDIDFVAVPWRDDCTTAELLIRSMANNYLVIVLNKHLVDAMQGTKPELKPHGRLAYRFPMGNGACIDISVMPDSSYHRIIK